MPVCDYSRSVDTQSAPLSPENEKLPAQREEERRQALGAPQISTLHTTSSGTVVGMWGCFHLRLRKAEARQRSEDASGLEDSGKRRRAGQGRPLLPSLPGPYLCCSPKVWGPDHPSPAGNQRWLTVPPCTEGTSEAREDRPLRGSWRQRRPSILDPPPTLQSGVGVPLPPKASACPSCSG